MVPYTLSWMILTPAVGAIVQAFAADRNRMLSKWIALISSLVSSVLAVTAVVALTAGRPEVQQVETFSWIGSYAIQYELGLDGLNALLILLIALVLPILIAYEWKREQAIQGMNALFLLLQSALIGAVTAQDLFLQFFFWSLSAVPFYFLIGVWGGVARERAAFRYMVYATLGNLLLFAALILIYYAVEPHSFSLKLLSGGALTGKTFELWGHTLLVSQVAFALVCIGLCLRAPLWPLHGWFSELAKHSPPSVLVALSSTVFPVAIYLLVRLCYSLFPDVMAASADAFVSWGMVSLLICGLCAIAQVRLSLLYSYFTVAKISLLVIGVGSLSAAGAVGAVYDQISTGLALAGFGLMVGILSTRLGTDEFRVRENEADVLRPHQGLAISSPWLGIVAAICVAALLSLPGTGGFVGGALLMIGSFSVHPGVVIGMVLFFFLSTSFLFSLYRNVFFGPEGKTANESLSLGIREQIYFLPIVLGLLFLGLYPKPFLEIVRPTVLTLLSVVR